MISVSFTNNMRDITSGIGTAVPSEAPEFTQFLVWVCVAQSLISVHCLSFHLGLLVALFIYSSLTYLSLKKTSYTALYYNMWRHYARKCINRQSSARLIFIGKLDFSLWSVSLIKSGSLNWPWFTKILN